MVGRHRLPNNSPLLYIILMIISFISPNIINTNIRTVGRISLIAFIRQQTEMLRSQMKKAAAARPSDWRRLALWKSTRRRPTILPVPGVFSLPTAHANTGKGQALPSYHPCFHFSASCLSWASLFRPLSKPPSTIRAPGALGRSSWAVFPSPLPPEVANRTMVFPRKS